jgi:hypothetical protein
LIERAYQLAEACGIPLWNQDEAGPYATRPQPGGSWQLQGKANLQPHEYLRDEGAKLMTLCASGDWRGASEGGPLGDQCGLASLVTGAIPQHP